MPRADTLREQLAAQGERRETARAEASAALDEIARLAPKAIKAGVPKLEIARLTGISRVTLDGLLKR